MNPTPTPAANSIATQDMILKSGVAVGPPNRIFPSGLMVSAMQKPNTSTAVSAKSQSALCSVQVRAAVKYSAETVGKSSVRPEKTMISPALRKKTGL